MKPTEKIDNINWFPGHMAKTRRLITENMKEVDIVIELLDARIPRSSRNPEIQKLIGAKPSLLLLNKASLADPQITSQWVSYYSNENHSALAIDCVTDEGIAKIGDSIRTLLREKIERWEAKGQKKSVRAMIVGIPNVGKSSLINKICKAKKVRVENRPGVTLTKQWVPTNAGFELMDMPGILWPKFEDKITGIHLAETGAIRDAILDTEELACCLTKELYDVASEAFTARYKLTDFDCASANGYELLTELGRNRGCLISGGEVNTERAANILLEEFRNGKIGRISLEKP